MTETIIDGEAFNIIVEGRPEAPAILLAHSLGTNLHLFDQQVAALRPHFRLVRYDLRGHGGSGTSAAPYSLAHLGRDALAVLDALRIDKADFIGASAGGLIGLWLLRHAPERIGRAVLANTAAQIGTPENWNERIRIVTENGVGALAPSLIENWFTRSYREQHPAEVRRFEETAAATSAAGYAGVSAAVRDADLREGLHAITHPVHVIVGRHDPVTPPGVGALLASSIPNAKLVTLEAAHLSAVEAAEAFNDAVLEFLLAAGEKPAGVETPAPAAPKKPRKPRAPKPKPVPVAAHEEPAPEFVPVAVIEIAKSEPRPRVVPKPKAPAKKSPAKKSPARKAAVKKRAAKKAAPRKAVVKKAAAKKPVRKLAAKKRVTRKVAVKKSPVRKAAVKKRPVKKVARKAVPKKSVRKVAAKRPVKKQVKKPVRKTAAKKSPRKAARRKAGRRR
ncbi:MAG: 3-oxoadipate enol-lactonase [Methylovirgula sp.]